MPYIPPGNSTSQSNASTSSAPIPFLGVMGGTIGLFFIVKSRYTGTVHLQMLNNANPSQKYETVKGLKKQATWTLTQPSSVEVCAICIEVLRDQDNVRRLGCKHVFHTGCIDSWFQRHHVDCPLCKSLFIPDRRSDPEDVY
ncbi:uncharacterized protein B0J16DRAFT_201525 [Fusarium flagelliforme]|uniref:uncharacterized protein n=1 Tax=Fusarium flagelliforme TaxID=2675880 RepID=UPI001E8EB189|nr:uncharacterized protein B0J16DRAFT_49440 [Fusarium flagelliforme]XP_045977451.1 uncharacterized protein B0J16DRAFT_201525 [Fusarium flagelliforme]KAH7169625.1 hypothetical protein B0J16DRAFT_49440 [Fusarium flagelliforme]KAH7169852.1 hypothetical protein B0J16DRAFT_201525 [Fusarium flagelliforme]